MPELAADLLPNPNYGQGVFRRRIRLTGLPGKVIGELEDSYHGFRVRLHHDDQRITAVDAEALRTPFNVCSGAVTQLKALAGIPLNTATAELYQQVDPKQNCTHLYDLSVLAMHHALRGETIRQLDIAVDDEPENGPSSCKVELDGRVVLDWQIQDWLIKTPSEFHGQSIYKGFSRWAKQTLGANELDAALALQKGYFVAQARKYDIAQMADTPAQDSAAMQGVCYTYSPGIITTAKRVGSNARDFTDTPELLLKFVP